MILASLSRVLRWVSSKLKPLLFRQLCTKEAYFVIEVKLLVSNTDFRKLYDNKVIGKALAIWLSLIKVFRK